MAKRYHTFVGAAWQLLAWDEIKRLGIGHVWSGRLSTGIFGSYDCRVGNLGPKSSTEVLVAPGGEGLAWLVDNAFRPCPVCTPHEIEGFYDLGAPDSIGDRVERIYGSRAVFEDPGLLPFDARTLPWEFILSLTESPPGRLYVPKTLSAEELVDLRDRFERVGHALPHVGWYDPDAPGRFSEYTVPRDTQHEAF